jgi:hypothetical protein
MHNPCAQQQRGSEPLIGVDARFAARGSVLIA